MASSAQKKMYNSKRLKTIRMWPFSDNFTVQTDDEARISLWKKICITEHFKWVYFFSWIEDSLQFSTL